MRASERMREQTPLHLLKAFFQLKCQKISGWGMDEQNDIKFTDGKTRGKDGKWLFTDKRTTTKGKVRKEII